MALTVLVPTELVLMATVTGRSYTGHPLTAAQVAPIRSAMTRGDGRHRPAKSRLLGSTGYRLTCYLGLMHVQHLPSPGAGVFP